MRTLTYYVNASLDGFIAGPGGEVDVFPFTDDLRDHITARYPETLPTHLRGPLGVPDAPNRRFDAVVMGRRTYEPALALGITSPYAHLDQYVVSATLPADQPADQPGPTLVPDDPVALVRRLKAQDGLGVWLAGGGRLAGAVLDEVDVLVVKRSPVVLGAGVPMVAGGAHAARAFRPVEVVELPSGTTVTTYERG